MPDNRNLRIFCPTHEAGFEVAESPKILCEITGHTLSVGFPNSEFWEFCCNCETFTPSGLDKGDKARAICYGCGNDISKRFVCARCKTVSFECGAQTKGKRYSISAGGIEPTCPGCQAASQSGALAAHQCEEIDASIITARIDCPFCLGKTGADAQAAKVTTVRSERQVCPNCGTRNPPSSNFCGQCRHQLHADVVVPNLGSDLNRSQLLGSLCPNCSSPVPPDGSFCSACGQAVKKASLQDEQTPSIRLPEVTTTAPLPPVPSPNNSARNITLAIGAAIFLYIFIAGVVPSRQLSSNSSVYNTDTSYTTYTNTTTPTTNTDSFERNYRGTINGQDFSMSIKKSGRSITGTASTSRNTDILSGRIESNGSFKAEAYKNGTRRTGIYVGQMYANGTINGNWMNLDATKEVPFSVSQQR